ncbi:MAG: hypothetical protein WD426_03320 [Anditalea sp.]
MYRILFLIFPVFFISPCFGQENSPDEAKPVLQIGGALRFNYNLSTWKEGQLKRGGDFGYDMFRINATGEHRGIKLDTEFRVYSAAFGGPMLKQGWFGYDFSDKAEIQVGLNQVPFGIQQYNSNNWFFNLTYYIGFEDDHDMGVKYIHDNGDWQWQAAYYLSAEEFVFAEVEGSPNRYSYDILGRNKENNQLNLKLMRRTGAERQHEFGVSGMAGLLYNLDTKQNGTRTAGAIHYEYKSTQSPWNIKLEAMTYRFDPAFAEDEAHPNQIEMGAYGANYRVATMGDLYTVGVSYLLPVNAAPLESITFYNNYGFYNKRVNSFENSHMNVLGCMLTAGLMYIYVDNALGYNHPWLGPEWTNAFSEGTTRDTRWHLRFNINMGLYF